MEAFAYSEASLNTAPYEAVHLEKKMPRGMGILISAFLGMCKKSR
jgi:hypothetical protein